ncbi:FtsK/SpoIIIE domain-containing protein [Blastococcus sp. SYSU D00820]
MTASSSRSTPPRCWTLVAAEGTVEVEVGAADDVRLGQVVAALTSQLGLPAGEVWSGSDRLADDLPLGAPPLRHGAVLGWGRPGPRSGGGPGSALSLHVTGGPDAGRILPLDRGRHVVGRGSGADLALDDPGVSRRHAAVEVGGSAVTVADLGARNGTTLDGRPLEGAGRPWPEGATVRLGASALTLRGPSALRLTTAPAPGGRRELRPGDRLAVPRREVEIPMPSAPAAPPRRPLGWIAVCLPAVGACLVAWLLRTPAFLLLALTGPLVAVGTWLSDRWTGRRRSRRDDAAHAAAVAEAEARVERAVLADVRAAAAERPDLGVLLSAAHRRTEPLWQRRAGDPDALTVRLGTAPGATRVTRVGPDGRRAPVPAAGLPLTVDLAPAGLGVAGPRQPVLGVVAGVLAQAVTLLPPADLQLVVVTTSDRLPDWRWLRWLPHLAAVLPSSGPAGDAPLVARLTDRTARSAGALPGQRVVVVLDRPAEPALLAALRDAGRSGVVPLVTAAAVPDLPPALGATLQLTGPTATTGTLRSASDGERADVVLDRVTPDVAAALARDLAPLTSGGRSGALPREVRLTDLLAADLAPPAAGPGAGWSRERTRLTAVLGQSVTGTVTVDLCRDGPHALVAGTTGSGKSELLQALVAGLALHHPPDRCSFLLVDYKGGAAFAEAASLPHTVGLLTDLDARTTARALRSLTAELARRETLLAAEGVADIAALDEGTDLARLVIVVDEFAGLAEELPGFVSGLVAIAQRGRSLGIHLVLATQRPGGVVSPEIRANCSLRLCLRTTGEAESRDVLGTPHAAGLPPDLPGRAFLRTGSAAPVLLQVARVGGSAAGPDPGPSVRRATWPPRPAMATPAATGGPSDLARLCTDLADAAIRSGVRAPHRPWCPELPDRLSADTLAAVAGPPAPAGSTRLRLGLVDRPDRQSQEALEVDLATGGGWLAVGGPGSGRSGLLRTVLGEAARTLAPDRLHVHVLDGGGGALAAEAARLPHTGTALCSDEVLRAGRLVARLTGEVAERRRRGRSTPPVLLLVDGAEAVLAALDDADPGGSTALLRLVRDGTTAGLTCVLTADRAVPGGRLAAAAGMRLVLPLPDRADYGIAGIPPRAVPGHRPPGRALVGDDDRECQLVLPRPPAAAHATGAPSGALRIVELPADPVLSLPAVPGGGLLLPVGPGGDEGGLLSVDLRRTGGLLVVGPPGSGRSAALTAFATHLRAAGAAVAAVTRGPRSGPRSPAVALAASDTTAWQAWLSGLGDQPAVVVLDDAGALAESPVVTAMAGAELPDGLVVVAAGTAGELAGAYRGPVAALRRRRTGLLLRPGPGDGDVIGVRLPRAALPARPGSGWLVTAGEPVRVQVSVRRTR